MGIFDKIKTGLEEAIAYEQGAYEAKVRKTTVPPISHYDATEIRAIRARTGMTQAIFTEFMGVSVKTVESWEAGRNYPIGSACRLLYLTKVDPAFHQKAGILVR